jgi:hypothetical protein
MYFKILNNMPSLKTKHLKFKIVLLFLTAYPLLLFSQTDSTRTLFKKFPKNLKWQWNLSFTDFNFKSAVLLGTSADLIGIVYKDHLHFALGIEEATNNIYLNPYYNDPKTYGGANYHAGYYALAEPIFRAKKLWFFSVPVKLLYYQNMTGTKNNFTDGLTAAPGLNAGINLFKSLALGVGANYRFGLNGLFSSGTYVFNGDNYSLLLFLKITI